jgi:transcriptional regulator with AAA-type ATPase domain
MEKTLDRGDAVQFRLVIQSDGSVRTVPLTGDRWIVGRSLDSTIVLRDATVSRRHLLIERHGSAFRFQDLGGSNPILIDGKPAREGVVEPGQAMQVGLSRLCLEPRRPHPQVVSSSSGTVLLSREIIDDEAPAANGGQSFAGVARRILERIEWTFADLGSLADAAEPLLDLALNLTARRRGVVGRFTPGGPLEPLASLDLFGAGELRLPDQVLVEAQKLRRPNLMTMQEGDRTTERVVVPLGVQPDGLLVLEEPLPDAPRGQELLRLARTLGVVVWHRLQEAAERLRLRDDVQRLRFHGTPAHNALLASTRLQDLRQRLRELANGDGPVLLVGEEGTEREDLARYMHVEGNRAAALFVAVDAVALPEWHLEAELFGDLHGHQGAIARARGGTLFVDNPQAMPIALQDRLAAALREADQGGAPPPGPPPRLVVGTEIAPAADTPAWSPALAALLGSLALSIPPLRSDARDVMALAELFLSEMGYAPDGSPRLLSERSKRLLIGYPWPGNVRQLRMVLESAAARAGSQPIAPRHLPDELAEPTVTLEPAPIPTLEDVEQKHIRDVLQRVGGNRARTAQALGIAASTLYEKLRRYSIES